MTGRQEKGGNTVDMNVAAGEPASCLLSKLFSYMPVVGSETLAKQGRPVTALQTPASGY